MHRIKIGKNLVNIKNPLLNGPPSYQKKIYTIKKQIADQETDSPTVSYPACPFTI
jgi:hypothetical protein